jgi:hypothetical protein
MRYSLELFVLRGGTHVDVVNLTFGDRSAVCCGPWGLKAFVPPSSAVEVWAGGHKKNPTDTPRYCDANSSVRQCIHSIWPESIARRQTGEIGHIQVCATVSRGR